MKTKNIQTLIIGLILASFLIGAYLHPHMPEKMASHWDANGNVDGYTSKFWGLFLMPVISTILFLAFMLIPKIDPLKENIEEFRGYFDVFILLLIGFLFYLYMLTLLWNLGYRFNIIQLLAPAFGLIIFYAGVMMENAKQNWFIGVRTPWTLTSENVWNKTNRLAGKLFKVAGVLAALGAVFPEYAILLILVPVILAAIYPVIYSYQEYQLEMKAGSGA
ncbi:MAG TPA: SdpI family protein [Methanotrichaceae archaeon]|nr:SdpI family protein [Methanotrichaceae archaeon]